MALCQVLFYVFKFYSYTKAGIVDTVDDSADSCDGNNIATDFKLVVSCNKSPIFHVNHFVRCKYLGRNS